MIRMLLLLALWSPWSWSIPVEGHQIMISAPSSYAVDVGREVIALGGNVVDVTVAVGLSLSVTSPYFASLGGGGFALVKMGEKVEALDFRETAPAATGPDYFVKNSKDSRTGGAAVGVPGVPAGLWELHKKYGKLPWRQLFTMPTRMAQKGFRVSGEWVGDTQNNLKRFNASGKKLFFKSGGNSYKPGEIIRQPGLAYALRELSRKNVKGFYQGPVAKDIVKAVNEAGGVMTLKDLADYKVRWLEPMTTKFADHKIYLMPPPSSGGVIIETALKLIDKVKLANYQPLSVDELHLMGEILSRSFRGRQLLGDPAYHENPFKKLLSADYLKSMADSISVKKTSQLEPLEKVTPHESENTTHFSVLDSKGNAVALTVTLNGNYGSGVVTPAYGIALNNEMDDFTTQPGKPNMFGLIQGEGNLVQGGKRPLSSMSPTLVEKDGKIVMSLGAPGGPRIISGVLQVLYRVLVSQKDMDQAIQMPRVHHQFLPHVLFIDKGRLSPEIIKALEQRGHTVKESNIARVNGVRINSEGYLEAAFDSRGEGAAGGL
ncbi:MAG: gamma-glutamyltransferase [Bdellovibrionales bacterium]|nr:gamma-glutamyltransferase [Bdellovibrionales bacterium]